MIRFKVPATSANIGPGFDCLGLAYTFSNEYAVDRSKTMIIEGCDPKYANKNNLFNTAFTKTMQVLKKTGTFHLRYESKIPISRGLGSSASIIVAGCIAANLLYGGKEKLSKKDIFKIASEIEGHPDNVAPAIFGGLTASIKLDDGKYYCSKYNVSPKLSYTALIPNFKTSTKKARKILPKTYDKSEVVKTISHSILMVEALKNGDYNLLKTACKDYIHEPYRKTLIKDYDYIKKEVEKNNDAILLISGSGPTLLAISKNKNFHTTLKLNKSIANWNIKALEIKH